MFNVGDRVKIVNATEDFFKGLTGTIVSIEADDDLPYDVKFDAGLIPAAALAFVKFVTGSTTYPAKEDELQLI